MIVLFTDFGLSGPYIGQMKAVLHRAAPGMPIIDLFADVPLFEPQPAAYLLAAYCGEFPADTVFLCVVDPGVGGARAPLILRAGGHWFVGPDNGLFNVIAQRAEQVEWWEITWRPQRLSASFHGRDLFAPVTAGLAMGEPAVEFARRIVNRPPTGWPEDLAKIVYIDRFGNAMTGVRAVSLDRDKKLEVKGRIFRYARTFAAAQLQQGFWYENGNGLVEIAVNQGSAKQAYGLSPGDKVVIID